VETAMDSRIFEHRDVVLPERAGERLDSYLPGFPWAKFDRALCPSRATVQKWIIEGYVTLNGETFTDKSYKLRAGDVIVLRVEIPLHPATPPPEPLEIKIVYRDDDIVVIDKPPGISSHPVPNDLSGSVVNFLIHQNIALPPTSNRLRPGIVHRLDKNTSGLMVIASTDRAYLSLIEMIKRREVHREYVAIVLGNPPVSGTIDAAIQRSTGDRTKMAVGSGGAAKPARTHYRVVAKYPAMSVVRCVLDTGRTHQIRVHMSHIGYPVAGDPTYGGENVQRRVESVVKWMSKKDPGYEKTVETLSKIVEVMDRDKVHMLHAIKLSFPHPISGENLEFNTEPHEKMKEVLELLEGLEKK
jgi:23S rRNA pseudouridine1911/1915/1917 synthase